MLKGARKLLSRMSVRFLFPYETVHRRKANQSSIKSIRSSSNEKQGLEKSIISDRIIIHNGTACSVGGKGWEGAAEANSTRSYLYMVSLKGLDKRKAREVNWKTGLSNWEVGEGEDI